MVTEKRGRLILGAMLIAFGIMALLPDGELTGWLWVVVFAGGAAAFIQVYRTSRTPWALLGAYIAGVLAGTVALGLLGVAGDVFPVLVMLAIAAPFLYAWWIDRRRWPLLVPAYVMGAIAFMLLFGVDEGQWVASYVMWVIALPFLVAFLADRENWGMLVPAAVLFAVGLVTYPGLSEKAGMVIAAVAFLAGGGLLLVRAVRSRAT